MKSEATPGRDAELLALAARLEKQTWGTKTGTASADLTAAAAIVRIAATSPSPDSMNERRIAEDTRLASNAREEAAYAAYLGICVLATMCKKAGLSLAEKRTTELLIEMGTAFPEFAGRSSLRASTAGEPKR